MKLQGVLIWWSRSKHCGVILEPQTEERFFVHIGRIIKGPVIPQADSPVLFEIGPLPATDGRLRSAVNVEVLARPNQVKQVEKTGEVLKP